MLLGVLQQQFFVKLFVFDHLDLVRRLDERNLLLALGALEVIHAFREAHELALHLLPLLDLLLDSVFHEGALVELLAFFELNLKALLALVAFLRLGEKSESLLLFLLFHLLADAHSLASAALLFETLRFGLLVQALRGDAGFFEDALLLLQDALLFLLAALDDDLAREGHLVLVLDLGEKLGGVRPRRQRRGGSFGVHHLHALLELLRHRNEVVLDVVTLQLIALESHALVLVVEANGDSAALGGVDEDAFHLGKFQEGDNLLEGLKFHRLVHLGRLLQHAHDGQAAHAGKELRELDRGNGARGRKLHGLRTEGGEHRLRVLAHVKRMELLLEQRPNLTRLRGHEGKNTLGDELVEQSLAGEHLAGITFGIQGVPEKSGHAHVTLLCVVELLVGGRSGGARLVGRDRHGREEHRRGHRLEILRSQVTVVRLAQVEQLVPSVGVVQVVLRHPEHLGELGKVRRHHLGIGRPLQDDAQAVDVLDGAERLLPQLKLRRGLQLLKSGLEVVLLGLGERQIGPVALVAVLHQVRQVVAQNLAQTAELGGALVGDAEGKRAVSRHGVQRLELVVVTQNFEDRAVRFPKELEPGRHSLAVRAILFALHRDRLEHQVLGRVLSLEIAHREGGVVGRRGRSSLRRLGLLRRELKEVLDHLLERLNVHLLAHDPVLDQTILREAPFLQLDAQLDVLEHDLLKHLLPCAVALRGDHIVESLKRRVRLTDVDQLLL